MVKVGDLVARMAEKKEPMMVGLKVYR